MIKLENFTKIYNSTKNPAVSDFNMVCEHGKITGILGPNGSGKTTILKAIAARHFATNGHVYVDDLDCEKNAEIVRNLCGFVTENSILPEDYIVCDYVKEVAELHGVKKQLGDCLKNVKELCSLEEVWNKKIKTLSKGFKERLNFAQALVYSPKILILDEPASGLDPAQILKMRQLVNSLKQNHTIVLSTHLMQEVDALCDKIYIISNGKKLAEGTAKSIAQDNNCATLEEAFFKLVNVIEKLK